MNGQECTACKERRGGIQACTVMSRLSNHRPQHSFALAQAQGCHETQYILNDQRLRRNPQLRRLRRDQCRSIHVTCGSEIVGFINHDTGTSVPRPSSISDGIA